MKNFKNVLAATAFLGLVAGFTFSASAQNDKQGFATVIRIEGACSYSLGDGNWHPLVPGKYLPPGASIRTGDNGVVDMILGKAIQLPQAKWAPERISQAPDAPVRGLITYKPSAEQNMIRLTPNTVLAIDKLNITDTGADTVNDTELDLKQGKIFASVKKLNGASQYIVKIPNGVAGVRGTWFSISANGSVSVYESKNGGLVLSLTINGITKTYLVSEGQFLDPFNGNGTPGAIPPNVSRALNEIFTALKTIYAQNVDFTYDHTTCFISPTTGKHKGGDNGGDQQQEF